MYMQPDGWHVTIDEKDYKFRGTLVAFVGDTPAINMVGGFKEGVGFALRKCRQCMATHEQIQTKVCLKLMAINHRYFLVCRK